MSLSAAVIDALVQAGATVEQLAAAMKASLAEQEAIVATKREKDAARQRKSRSNRLSRNVTVTPRDTCDQSPPNDIYSNPPGFDVSNETSAVSSLPVRVVEAWNTGSEGAPLPKARKLSADRVKQLRARVRQHGEEAVFTAIANMHRSDFHSGRSGKWMEGSLGWLLETDKNFQKMLERTNADPPPSSPSNLTTLLQYRPPPKEQAA